MARKFREAFGNCRYQADETDGVTDDVRRWKLMGLGALGIVGIGASALTFIMTKFGASAAGRVVGK